MSPERKMHQWKVLEMSHIESHTGPSEGSVYQIFCRNQKSHAPNCIATRAVDLLVDALMAGVKSSGAAKELQIRLGFLFAWSTEAIREIRMRSPNTNSATSTGKIMLNLRYARSNSSCQQKAVASSVRVDTCEPVAMVARIVVKGQSGPTSSGQPIYAYSLSSGDTG